MKISVLTMTCRPNGLEAVRNSLLKQTFTDFEWLVDINWTGKVDFNKASNRLLKRSQGELIVFVQDYVELPEDGLQQFWDAHKEKPIYYTAPVTHYDEEGEKSDWRLKTSGTIEYQGWEIDCGSAPRDLLFETGGFDEDMDKYWGYDNVSVALRAQMLGHEFACLPHIHARAYDHNKHLKHEFRHLQNLDYANTRMEYIKQGIVVVDCLTNTNTI